MLSSGAVAAAATAITGLFLGCPKYRAYLTLLASWTRCAVDCRRLHARCRECCSTVRPGTSTNQKRLGLEIFCSKGSIIEHSRRSLSIPTRPKKNLMCSIYRTAPPFTEDHLVDIYSGVYELEIFSACHGTVD